MKKTCLNCEHYKTLYVEGSDEHYHDFCRVLKTFLNGELKNCSYDFPEDTLYFDDFETGQAGCYMFTPKDKPFACDEWFDANLAHNNKFRLADDLID